MSEDDVPKPPEDEKVDGENPFDKVNMKSEKPGRPKTKLESMGCWTEVEEMLKDGAKISEIVYHIQEVRAEYLDIKPDTLRTYLYTWLNRNFAKLKDAVRIPTKYLTLMNGVDTRIDPLDAVNMLFAIQVDRVMLDYEMEKKSKKSLSGNNHNLRLANEMIKTMSVLMLDKFKYKAFMAGGQDTSKTGKETLEQLESVKRQFSERFGETAAAVALDSASRRKVFNALSKVRKSDTEPMLKLLRLNEETAERHAGSTGDD